MCAGIKNREICRRRGIAGFNAEYDSLVYADVPERDAAPRASVGRAEPSVQRLECVCFYTGLFYWLPLTAQFEGQLNSLSAWQPGMSAPTVPYRFRFHEPVPDMTHFRRTTGAMMAFRLLPEKVIHWLSGTPKALQALSDVVTEPVNGDNDLQRVLNEALAAFPAGALPAFSSVVSMSAPDASSSVLSGQPENDIASLAPAELAQSHNLKLRL